MARVLTFHPARGMTDSSSDPNHDFFPDSGRLAAVDFGTVRIGVAVCDPGRILASPLEVRAVGQPHDDAEYFRQLVRREKIGGWVVGLPIHCDGGESQKSRQCREFAQWLATETETPVRLFDERFTTSAARQRIAGGGLSRKKKKGRLDAVAALVLLEAFLEACRHRGEVAGQPIGGPAEGGDSLE